MKQSIDKKRKYEEGHQIQNLYNSLFHDHQIPTPSILQTTSQKVTSDSSITTTPLLTTDSIEDSTVEDCNNIGNIHEKTLNPFEQIMESFGKTIEEPIIPVDSNPPTEQGESFNQLLQQSFYQFTNTPSPENILAFHDMDFGVARKDLEKDKKRFEWIQEELNYLQHYVQYIEKECDKKNRFAACLNHLRTEASPDVKKYFHPHHIANSDRLKNGFNTALKKIR